MQYLVMEILRNFRKKNFATDNFFSQKLVQNVILRTEKSKYFYTEIYLLLFRFV